MPKKKKKIKTIFEIGEYLRLNNPYNKTVQQEGLENEKNRHIKKCQDHGRRGFLVNQCFNILELTI